MLANQKVSFWCFFRKTSRIFSELYCWIGTIFGIFYSYYQISSDDFSNKLLTNEEKMIFSSVSSISTGLKVRHYSRHVFAITWNFIGLHIKSQVSAYKTPLRTKRSGVRIPCSAPSLKSLYINGLGLFFCSLISSKNKAKTAFCVPFVYRA